MKVMVALPMANRSDEEVQRQLHDIRMQFNKLHIDVVDNFFTEEIEGYNNKALFYLGKSIDLIGKVDAVYFAPGWRTARGCIIERRVCEEYGVKILDEDFLLPKSQCQVKRII